MRKIEYSQIVRRKLKALRADLTLKYGEDFSKRTVGEMTTTVRRLEKFSNCGVKIAEMYDIDTDYYYLFVNHNYFIYRIEPNKVIIANMFSEKEDFMMKLFDSMREQLKQLDVFWKQADEKGITNLEKTKQAKVIRRVASTDKSKSFEETDAVNRQEYPLGTVVEEGKLIGFGIHIFNEDVYPLQSFEIYLRGCDLAGELDLSHCTDMVFVDIYNNRISSVHVKNMPKLRILGLQNNRIRALDPSELPACQGIDVGKNLLDSIDVTDNSELVELYVNDNKLTRISLAGNPKLKYFYCHNNMITELDTRNNPLLRHLDATGNPMKKILSLAPQSSPVKPLELYADNGGSVGLKFYPVYNAQWKETGEWKQSYHAYPKQGYHFAGWKDENGNTLSAEQDWVDTYGESRVIFAHFEET